MAYEDKPLATDKKNSSQGVIRENFSLINTLVSADHEDFDAGANTGKHKQTTLRDTVVVPATTPPATEADEVMLYSVGQALRFRPAGQAAGIVANDVDFTTATLAATGTCTIPCGIIMKWGTGTINAGQQNSAATVFAAAFPTALYSVQLTPYTAQTGAAQDYVFNVYNQTVAGFTVNRNHGYVGTVARFYYLAIGV